MEFVKYCHILFIRKLDMYLRHLNTALMMAMSAIACVINPQKSEGDMINNTIKLNIKRRQVAVSVIP